MDPERARWLAQTVEPAIEPDLPIVDSHHHLWTHSGDEYVLIVHGDSTAVTDVARAAFTAVTKPIALGTHQLTILASIAEMGADTGFLRAIPQYRAVGRTSDIRKTLLLGLAPVAPIAVIKIDRGRPLSHRAADVGEEIVADDISAAGWVASLVNRAGVVGFSHDVADDVELKHVIVPADQDGLVRGIFDEVMCRPIADAVEPDRVCPGELEP